MSAVSGPQVLAYCTCGHFMYDHLVRFGFPQGACQKCPCGGATMGGEVYQRMMWPYRVPLEDSK